MTTRVIYYHPGGEWAAMYEDGRFVPSTVGDTYVAEEEALRRSGVQFVHGEDFLLGGSHREHAAPTTDDIKAYVEAKEAAAAQAALLRQEAARLIEQANELSR